MKILIHGLNFNPEIIGIGKYTGELAAWLVESGNDVHVVTTPPYYPQWKIQPGYTSWKYQKEYWRGVEVIRCPLWVPQKPTGLNRIFHLLSFAIFSMPAMLAQVKWKPDLVLNIIPTLFSSHTSIWIARLTKAKSWLHIQDFELEAARVLGLIKISNLINQIAEKWEISLFSKFDIISSISNKMVTRIQSKGVPETKVVLFPNWIDTKIIFPIQEGISDYRRSLGISDEQYVVLYAGNMGNKQGLEVIVEVARKMKENENIIFLLCGNGPARIHLEKSSLNLNNVRFLDLQPLENLNTLLNTANVHLLPQRSGTADLVMPSKLLGMLASGKPIIATANPQTELANIINQIGIVVPHNNHGAIIQAINKLYYSPALRKEFGQKSRDFVCIHWDKEKILSVISKKFQEVLPIDKN